MSIDITCSCGKRLRAKAELAGRRVQCPACGQPLAIPAPSAEVQPLGELLDELSPSTSAAPAMPDGPSARPSADQPGPRPQRGDQPGPRYEIISGFFGRPWPAQVVGGWVVASREAIYLVASKDYEEAWRQGAELAAGPVGLFLEKLFGGKGSRRKPPPNDLPDVVRRDPEWPVRGRAGAVVILARAEVRALRFNWRGYLYIVTDRGKYKVAVGHFKMKKVRHVLTQMGWQL